MKATKNDIPKLDVQNVEIVSVNGNDVRVFSDGTTKWYVLKDIFNAAPESKNKVNYASRKLIDQNDPNIVTVSKDDTGEPGFKGGSRRTIINQKALDFIVGTMKGTPFEDSLSDLYSTVNRECCPVKVIEKVSPKPELSPEMGINRYFSLYGENTPQVHEFDGKL